MIIDGQSASDIEPGGEVIQPNAAQNSSDIDFQLVSDSTRDGSDAFEQGLALFRSRSLSDALGSFNTAVAAEPVNAIYHYYRALALFGLNSTSEADDALRQAIDLERDQPITNWGKRMERVQGRGRLWVENARGAAGLVH